MEIHWGEGSQFYVIPVSANEICLVPMTRNQHQRVAETLPGFPQLQKCFEGVSTVTSERGAYAVTRKLAG